LRWASALDLAGREPHVVLLVQLEGVRTHELITRTVVLRGRSNGEVTGAITALAVLAVDRKEVPPGNHFAADVLDPVLTLSRLAELGVAEPVVFDGAIDRLAVVEEGAL
jgi:hypothetical protein